MIDETFSTNLAENSDVTADSYRGNADDFHPSNLTDGNKNTYWATDDDVLTGSLEIDLGSEQEARYVQLQEYIALGQRVREFSIDVWQNGEWNQVAEATTIGYKRIIELKGVSTEKIRVNIKDSQAGPVLSSVEVF